MIKDKFLNIDESRLEYLHIRRDFILSKEKPNDSFSQ